MDDPPTVLGQTGRSFEPKLTVQDDSGRSFEPVDGHGLMLTVIRQKVDGPDELKDISVKMDGPRIPMSARIKVDGPKFQ